VVFLRNGFFSPVVVVGCVVRERRCARAADETERRGREQSKATGKECAANKATDKSKRRNRWMPSGKCRVMTAIGAISAFRITVLLC